MGSSWQNKAKCVHYSSKFGTNCYNKYATGLGNVFKWHTCIWTAMASGKVMNIFRIINDHYLKIMNSAEHLYK